MESNKGARPFTVIIPNRFEDIIQPLLKSIKRFEDPSTHILIVADNHTRSYGHDLLPMTTPFIYGRSANAGIKKSSPADVILLNDDVTLLQPNTFAQMARIANSDPLIGILTPQVDGGCGNLFMRPSHTELWEDHRRSVRNGLHYCCCRSGDSVTFACVYIKRKVFDNIGLFDENFTAYGFEDTDLCRRASNRGFHVVVTNKLKVRHGAGGEKFVRGKNWNTSFKRIGNCNSKQNLAYLMSKQSSNGNQLN